MHTNLTITKKYQLITNYYNSIKLNLTISSNNPKNAHNNPLKILSDNPFKSSTEKFKIPTDKSQDFQLISNWVIPNDNSENSE